MRGPLALSVAQRPPWGGRGFRGSHIAGGNCHRRTRGDHPGCRVGEEDVGGRGSQGNSSREQGTEEKESGKRSPGSEKEMGVLGPLRKQRNETASHAAKRTSSFPLDVTRVLVGAHFQCGGQDRSPVARAQCDPSVGMRKQAEHVSHLS